jgi:hypothetical protein
MSIDLKNCVIYVEVPVTALDKSRKTRYNDVAVEVCLPVKDSGRHLCTKDSDVCRSPYGRAHCSVHGDGDHSGGKIAVGDVNWDKYDRQTDDEKMKTARSVTIAEYTGDDEKEDYDTGEVNDEGSPVIERRIVDPVARSFNDYQYGSAEINTYLRGGEDALWQHCMTGDGHGCFSLDSRFYLDPDYRPPMRFGFDEDDDYYDEDNREGFITPKNVSELSPSDKRAWDRTIEHAKIMQENIAQHTLEEPIVVTRDYAFMKMKKTSPATEMFDKLNEGDTFSEKGFSSTSLSDKLKRQSKDTEGYVMQIQVPVGAKAAFIGGAKTGYEEQKELILNAGTDFEILEIDHQKKTGVMQVVIPKD